MLLMPILLLTAVSMLLSSETIAGGDNEELEHLIRKGTAALRAGNFEDALALAKQAVANAPRQPRAYLGFGRHTSKNRT